MSGATAYVDLLTLTAWYERQEPSGAPSVVVFSEGATDGIELATDSVTFGADVAAAGGVFTPLVTVAGDTWQVVRGRAGSIVVGTDDTNTKSTVYDLASAPVSFDADPTTVQAALVEPPPSPGSGAIIAGGLVLADGSMPFAINLISTGHVPASGDYDFETSGDAAGALGIGLALLFGAAAPGSIILSMSVTGPDSFRVFVRDGAGAPVDAAFYVAQLIVPA